MNKNKTNSFSSLDNNNFFIENFNNQNNWSIIDYDNFSSVLTNEGLKGCGKLTIWKKITLSDHCKLSFIFESETFDAFNFGFFNDKNNFCPLKIIQERNQILIKQNFRNNSFKEHNIANIKLNPSRIYRYTLEKHDKTVYIYYEDLDEIAYTKIESIDLLEDCNFFFEGSDNLILKSIDYHLIDEHGIDSPDFYIDKIYNYGLSNNLNNLQKSNFVSENDGFDLIGGKIKFSCIPSSYLIYNKELYDNCIIEFKIKTTNLKGTGFCLFSNITDLKNPQREFEYGIYASGASNYWNWDPYFHKELSFLLEENKWKTIKLYVFDGKVSIKSENQLFLNIGTCKNNFYFGIRGWIGGDILVKDIGIYQYKNNQNKIDIAKKNIEIDFEHLNKVDFNIHFSVKNTLEHDYVKVNKNIDSININYFEKTFFTINYNKIKYEFLLYLNNNSDNILVLGPGWMNKERYEKLLNKPQFDRHNWVEDFDENLIFFNDPTRYDYNELYGGWGIGTPENWHLENIAKIIKIFSHKITNYNENEIIPYSNLYLYGSSMGGFMSIILSIFIKNSVSIADIPQFNLLNWWYWDYIKESAFKKLTDEEIYEKYSERLIIDKLMIKQNYVPNVYLLLDCTDDRDWNSQFKDFLLNLNKLPYEYNNNENKIKIRIDGKNNGHTVLDRTNNVLFIKNIIQNHQIINDSLNIKNIKLNIKDEIKSLEEQYNSLLITRRYKYEDIKQSIQDYLNKQDKSEIKIEHNNFEIIETNIQESDFQNKQHNLKKIITNNEIIYLKIKCHESGKLRFELSSSYFKDVLGNKKLINIILRNFKINNTEIFNRCKSITFDNKYFYFKDCEKDEIILIEIKINYLNRISPNMFKELLEIKNICENNIKFERDKLVKEREIINDLKIKISEKDEKIRKSTQLSHTAIGFKTRDGKITYRNWWRGFKTDIDGYCDDIWFTKFIKNRFPDADYNLNFFSVFNKHYNIKDSFDGKKIFFSGEDLNYRFTDFNRTFGSYALKYMDLSMGYDLFDDKKYYRFPYWIAWHFKPDSSEEEIEKIIDNWNSQMIPKSKDVSSVSSHDNFKTRTFVANDIEKIIKIDYGGKWRNNTSDLWDKYNNNKIDFLKQYKFNLCVENVIDQAYVTEKIFDAIKSNCIPLYMGGEDYLEPKVINKKAILNWKYNEDNSDLLELFDNLLNDTKSYENFRENEPLLNTSTKYIIGKLDNLEKRFEKLIYQ